MVAPLTVRFAGFSWLEAYEAPWCAAACKAKRRYLLTLQVSRYRLQASPEHSWRLRRGPTGNEQVPSAAPVDSWYPSWPHPGRTHQMVPDNGNVFVLPPITYATPLWPPRVSIPTIPLHLSSPLLARISGALLQKKLAQHWESVPAYCDTRGGHGSLWLIYPRTAGDRGWHSEPLITSCQPHRDLPQSRYVLVMVKSNLWQIILILTLCSLHCHSDNTSDSV